MYGCNCPYCLLNGYKADEFLLIVIPALATVRLSLLILEQILPLTLLLIWPMLVMGCIYFIPVLKTARGHGVMP